MLIFHLDKASEIDSNSTMAQLAAVVLFLLHISSFFLLLPRGEILGSNAAFFPHKCFLLTPSRGCLCKKLV